MWVVLALLAEQLKRTVAATEISHELITRSETSKQRTQRLHCLYLLQQPNMVDESWALEATAVRM
jgi:ABC-type phosphate/phosphonate transport system ATPase subunit